MFWRKSHLPIVLLLSAWPAAAMDKLVLFDGRVIENCKVEEEGDERFARFPHGRVRLMIDQIKEIFIDSDETYVPRNDYEREQLDRGFVLFEGIWHTKRKRDAILEERRRKREKRLEELMKRLEWDNAWRRETPNFIMITNTSEDLLEYYASLFDKFYRLFTKRWDISISRGTKDQRPAIEIYRSREQYLLSGVPPGTAGTFDPLAKRLRLYHDASDPRFTLDVLLHEGTHLMVHLLRPSFIFPVWVNEGLAEFYGASVLEPDGSIRVGCLQEGRLAMLRYALDEGAYLPLDTVLLTPQSRFGNVHYAEAWCLVHFVTSHKKYKAKFSSYFTALATGTGLDEMVFPVGQGRNMSTIKMEDDLELFKKRMGLANLTELNRDLLEYVYYGLPDVGARGYMDSARIKLRYYDLIGALDDIKTAQELGSRDVNCLLYSARIHALMGRYEEAAVAYMKAIEQNPLNADFHLEAGQALRSSGDRTMLEEGLRHIHLASEIAPEEPRFRHSLGQALAGEDLAVYRKIQERWKDARPAKGQN